MKNKFPFTHTQGLTHHTPPSPLPALSSTIPLVFSSQVIESFIAAHSSAMLWNGFIHLNCHDEFWTAGQSCLQSHCKYGTLLLELPTQISQDPGNIALFPPPHPAACPTEHSTPLQALQQL